VSTPLAFPNNLYQILDLEIIILVLILSLFAYTFYRMLLGKVSAERHANLKNHFSNLFLHTAFFVAFSIVYLICIHNIETSYFFKKLAPYFASLCFFWGLMVFVKSCRILVLQYLFLGSMRAGVPLLLVNIFTLLLSVSLFFWALSLIFNVQLTPLLATSAAFSIILGLALQDTLGNLFAGISLQVDKAFEIGDWLEVQNGLVKITGQVKELSWRSTMLVGLSDEIITLPNKLIAGLQISNFSPDGTPIVRSHQFRFKTHSDAERAKPILEKSATSSNGVRSEPSTFAYIQEVSESWVLVKLIYFIDNFGKQFSIGDNVIHNSLQKLAENHIEIAPNKLMVEKD
jgi:small-conductance mechanosensitive channel